MNHAGGAGLSTLETIGVELQPTFASSNIALKLIDISFCILEFSGVFGIQGGNFTLTHLHIIDSGVCQLQILLSSISASFFFLVRSVVISP
ncbi:hypothetical protein MF895_18240 [Leclercia adecarboxylata]|nr:hypothetical protein [Leclercia adecarboxylata]